MNTCFETFSNSAVRNSKPALAQSFRQRDGDGGIRRLVTAAQAQVNVFVPLRLRLEGHAQAACLARAQNACLTLVNARRHAAIRASFEDHLKGFRRLRSD